MDWKRFDLLRRDVGPIELLGFVNHVAYTLDAQSGGLLDLSPSEE